MRRSSILVALASAALAVTVTGGVPTAAQGDAPSPAEPAAQPAAQPAAERHHYKPWGSTRAPVQVLRRGCHNYRFHYHIDLPPRAESGKAAEIFLKKPNGKPLASEAYLLPQDPKKAWDTWRICRPSTSYGRHTMQMKVTFVDDNDQRVEGWVRPGHMRLVRS